MVYEKDVYKKIVSEYEQIRMNSVADRQRRLDEVYKRCPKVEEIDKEITIMGSSAMVEILENPSKSKEISDDLQQTLQMLSEMRTRELALAGFEANYTDMRYECDLCKDEGYINGQRCECFKKRVIAEEYKKSNLMKLLDTQSFDKFDINLFSDEVDKTMGVSQKQAMCDAFEICKKFADNFENINESLFFYGGVGLGKTFLSTCVAKEIISKGYSVLYQSSAKLFSMYNDYLFGRIDPSEGKALIARLLECDLLIIDDLGSESVNSQTTSFLFEIVNDRILSGKKMLISTNYSISEIATAYSERFHSRILEHFIPIKFFGSDVRIKKMFG